MEKMYTPEELASELRMHPYTVRRFLREGRFKGAFQVGRHWKIPESAVTAWINEHQRQMNAESPQERVG
jgi:excisionase family DNA binding protein